MENIKNEKAFVVPYSEQSFATVPTGWTKFKRTSILYQIVRFFVINIKILRIVVGGHS